MVDAMNIGTGELSPRATGFIGHLHAMADEAERRPHVLELGTRRWVPDFPTHHKAWAPPGARWTMSDMAPGLDVDTVADAHDLEATFGSAGPNIGDWTGLDAYVAVSVYEHLQRPWIAAHSAAAVLRPGAWVYVATHQTFPLHGYPDDYFRFSAEGLTTLFADAGFVDITTGYDYACTIQPPPEVTRWNTSPDVPAWLVVDLLARRP